MKQKVLPRLLLITLAVAICPSILALWVTMRSSKEELLRYDQIRGEDQMVNVASEVSATLSFALSQLREMREARILSNRADEGGRAEGLLRALESSGLFADLAIHEPGNVLAATHDSKPAGASQLLFEAVKGDEIRVRLPLTRSVEPEEAAASFFIPILSQSGVPTGELLQADLPLWHFWSILDLVSTPSCGQFVLITAYGKVLAHKDRRHVFLETPRLLPRTPGWNEYTDHEGTTYQVLSEAVGIETDDFIDRWHLVYLSPVAPVQVLTASASSRLWIIGAVGLCLAGVASWWLLGLWSSRHMEESQGEAVSLSAQTHQVIAGLQQRNAKGNDDDQEEFLRAQLQAAYEAAGRGVFVMRIKDNKLLGKNQMFADFCQLSSEKIKPQNSDGMIQALALRFADSESFLEWWETGMENPGNGMSQQFKLASPRDGMAGVFASPICDAEGCPIAVLWSIDDVTNQQKLDRGLASAKRSERIGDLASGVAYEFNHVLAEILENLALLDLEECTADDRALAISQAKESASCGSQLVRRLLSFSQENLLDIEDVKVGATLKELKAELEPKIPKSISLKIEFPEQGCEVLADASRLKTVLGSLCENAVAAMPNGGTLRVHGEFIQLATSSSLSGGNGFVCFTVEDDGVGIPKEISGKIFDPFFGDSEASEGMGLATASGIVWHHGGWISFESEEGEGSSFRVYLPAAEGCQLVAEELPMTAMELVVVEDETKESTGTGKVLVIDDEDLVCRLSQAILERWGYQTLAASDGYQALEFYREFEEDISVVILDINMPRMNGKEFFRVLRKEFAYVPVIVVSGYVMDCDSFEEECGCLPDAFIQKPFQAVRLLQAVEDVLEVGVAA